MQSLRVLGGGFFVLALGAIASHAGDKKDGNSLVIPVSKPVQRNVTDFANLTGRISAKEFVTVHPRVTGYLVKIAFQDGAEVKAGDTLFEIDARPYQAQAAAAMAKVAQAEASLKLARAVNARFKALAKNQPAAVSAQELEQHLAQVQQAIAALDFAKANLQTAKLNLDWTVVRAPIAGRVGRAHVTVGNVVKQDETLLTTLLSPDPLQVYFEVDEETLLRIRAEGKKGKPPGNTVLMGLASEEGYPHRGTIDFIESQVNPKTGGILMRAILAKAKDRLLMPGMKLRLRLPISQPYEALLVIDRAVITDQGLKCVYVVNAENQVELRRLTLGPLQLDGLRVVEQGLKKDDTIAVGGLQLLRPRMKIQPELVTMPALK